MSKELIKEYANICYSPEKDKRMNDYILKATSEVIKTSQGTLIAFDKPTIETRFCFGFGCNGISTSEDVKGACDMAEHARTNEKYFLDENLKGINQKIEAVKNAEKVYIMNYNHRKNCGYYETEEELMYWNKRPEGIEATKEDVELIIKTLENEKEKFTKRLNTYLKRYGLSKVHSWTYLVD